MKNTKLGLLFVAALTLGTLTACGGGDVINQTSTTTMGQELSDLDASFKSGILTEKEYKNAKEAILEKYDN